MCFLNTVVNAALKQGFVLCYLSFESGTEIEEFFFNDDFLRNDDDSYGLA